VNGVAKAAILLGVVVGLLGAVVHEERGIALGAILIFGGIFILIDFRT
jgi:hypothetical protein